MTLRVGTAVGALALILLASACGPGAGEGSAPAVTASEVAKCLKRGGVRSRREPPDATREDSPLGVLTARWRNNRAHIVIERSASDAAATERGYEGTKGPSEGGDEATAEKSVRRKGTVVSAYEQVPTMAQVSAVDRCI